MPETKKKAEKETRPAAKHAAPKKSPRKGWLKALITVIVALIVIFALVTVYANMYSGIYPNTYVNGTLVSKMSDAQLTEFISSAYSEEKLEDETFTFACTSQKVELDVSDIDLSFDHDAYLKKIKSSGKNVNPLLRGVSFISCFFTKEEVAPVMTYNAEILAEAFDDATDGFEEDPVGHTFTIGKDSVTIHDSVDGVKADRKKAYADVEAQISALKIGTVILEPVHVSADPINFDEFYAWLTSDAVDAYYEKEDGKVVVRDSKPKCEVEPGVVKDAIRKLESPEETEVVIPVITTEPENTAAKLTENLYKDELGTYTTDYSFSGGSRANNVRLAVERVNGTELMPGEEFSYDKKILPRTSANGYQPAGVYIGNKSDIGMGGGICQPSSTLYSAVLKTTLEVLERHPHSLPVSYLPYGMDATIAEGVLDFRFKNTSDYPIKIVGSHEGGKVKFSIMGYNPENISVELNVGYSSGGYHVTRIIKQDGKEIKRQEMGTSSYSKKEEAEKKPEEDKKKESSSNNSTEASSSENSSASNSSASNSSASNSSSGNSSSGNSSASNSSASNSSASNSSAGNSSAGNSSAGNSSAGSSSAGSSSAGSSSAGSGSADSSSASSSSAGSSSSSSSSSGSSSAASTSSGSSSSSSSAPAESSSSSATASTPTLSE